MELSASRDVILGVTGDVSIVVIIGVCSILIRQLATPFHRGFFKDDESLMYPFKSESTVPASVLYGVGFCLPSLVIMITEGVLLRRRQTQEAVYGAGQKGAMLRRWLWAVYKLGLMFYFGVVVTHFSTNVPKYTIGRLRPHFFAVCVPDVSQISNSDGYIEEDVCTGNNTADIKEARVSFPSGHSSMAIYCMLFLVVSGILSMLVILDPSARELYVNRRFTWQGMFLLKSFLQTLFSLMGGYTCLSRVSDYKHHWSDVLAGALLGGLVAGFVFWSLEKTIFPLLDRSENRVGSTKDSSPPPDSTPAPMETTML